jgi:hypothetical protein
MRLNYSFQAISDPEDLELAWCSTTSGPEDEIGGGGPSSCPTRIEGLTPDRIIFRVERQTLRRLPHSRAIVFGIRTYLTPLTELVKEEGVPERLKNAVKGWSEDVWTWVT